ncbi:MAG: hypothetical protein FJ318_01920 [SAR202 cluster bacterium]|nr:hypothetical protein [SAR202 cluster bacterium]
MTTNALQKHVESQVEKGVEDAIDALKWAKKHRNERKAIDTLRIVQANLNYLALAMDWEMEGEAFKAEQAVRKLWWQPSKESDEFYMGVQGC